MNNYEIKIQNARNSKLYEFLATSYDISTLAGKIDASKKASFNIFSLKKRVNSYPESNDKLA